VRVRALDASGDITFGRGGANYLVNSPQAVAQKVGTRLRLWQDEWFLDTSDGTPFAQGILGLNTGPLYDRLIQDRILGTPNVIKIVSYSSNLATLPRKLTVACSVLTSFSTEPVEVVV
jgi:hypothetical protein